MRIVLILLTMWLGVEGVYASDSSKRESEPPLAIHIQRKIYISVVKASVNSTDIAHLQARLRRAWFPGNGQPSDSAIISLDVDKDGKPANLKIMKSSQSAIFDDGAVKAINRVAPIKELSSIAGSEIRVEFK